MSNQDKSREQTIEAAKKQVVTAALNDCHFDKINILEVRELFNVLDRDKDGYMDCDDLRMLLREVINPPCAPEAVDGIIEAIQVELYGRIDLSFFYGAISLGKIRQCLVDDHRQGQMRQRTLDLARQTFMTKSVPRDFMCDRFEWRTGRDEAFRTLPFILVYFLIFLTLVITHLNIWQRQMGERAQEGHMAGWGYEYIGPYLEEHLPNVDQVYAWLQTSGMQFAFGYCAADVDKSVGIDFCELAPKHQLIGDVMIRQERKDGSERKFWLLHTPEALARLASEPDKRYDAALMALKTLRDNRWFDKDTVTMELAFSSYNDASRFFIVGGVNVRFDPAGYATHSSHTWSVPAESYPDEHKWVFALDGLFVVLLSIPFVFEVYEIANSIQNAGFGGFLEYWGFWNVIDWFMILNGIILIQLWVQCCLAIESDNVQSTLEFPSYTLKTSTRNLNVPQLQALYDDLQYTVFLYRMLHAFMTANTVAIMWKFAKSFQANARLQTVQETLKRALNDICHFLIVLTPVFIGYSIIGHIIFGMDFVHFNSFGASFNTAFLCLMGDFGWYSDLSVEVEPLGSGTPYFVVSAWYWSFMVISVQVLMNMLLAIVMDNYALASATVTSQPDSPPIWVQTKRYFQRRKQFKKGKWLSLEEVFDQLQEEDDDGNFSILDQDDVDFKSLKEAIPDIKEEQAEFIMEWMFRDLAGADAHHPAAPVMSDLQRLESIQYCIGENLHLLQVAVFRVLTRLDRLGSGIPVSDAVEALSPEPAAEPGQDAFPNVTEQLESQLRVLTELCGVFGKQQQSTQNLAVALTELTKFAPKSEPGPNLGRIDRV